MLELGQVKFSAMSVALSRCRSFTSPQLRFFSLPPFTSLLFASALHFYGEEGFRTIITRVAHIFHLLTFSPPYHLSRPSPSRYLPYLHLLPSRQQYMTPLRGTREEQSCLSHCLQTPTPSSKASVSYAPPFPSCRLLRDLTIYMADSRAASRKNVGTLRHLRRG